MSTLPDISNLLAAAVESVSRSVVTVNARPRLPSTGIHWRAGMIVTADHTVRADEDITITRHDGRTLPATPGATPEPIWPFSASPISTRRPRRSEIPPRFESAIS